MEEQNDLHAFDINECYTKEDKQDREEFMHLTGKAHLKRLRDSLRVERNDIVDAATTVTPFPTPPTSPEPKLPGPTDTVSTARRV